MKKLLYTTTILFVAFVFIQNIQHESEPTILAAAQGFLATLDEHQQNDVIFKFSDEERFNWNYTPVSRKGLPIKDMKQVQREAAFTLMRASLSEQGYEKAQNVRKLEEILRSVEGRGSDDSYRDPNNYYFSIFGKPVQDEVWGWRFEGHHISLNFSSVSDEIVSVTPTFFGANPARVPSGPRKGWRILKPEEDLARTFINSLSEPQRQEAVIAEQAYPDIVTGNDEKAILDKAEGIIFTSLNNNQQDQLMGLIKLYYRVHLPQVAEQYLSTINAEKEEVYFAWAGSIEPGAKHYYRIHGPSFVLEYDNTQNNANHIHTVIRDLRNDFGGSTLKSHYEEAHK